MSCIAWPDVKGALARAAELATGIRNPVWLHEQAVGVCPPFVELALLGSSALGIDEEIQSEADGLPAGAEINVEHHGQRVMTLQLALEDISFEPGAFALLERGRSAFAKADVRNVLSKYGLAAFDFSDIVPLDYEGGDGYWVSRAAFEVRVASESVIVDCPKTFIETVVASSEFIDPVGDLLPSPPNFTDLELPT